MKATKNDVVDAAEALMSGEPLFERVIKQTSSDDEEVRVVAWLRGGVLLVTKDNEDMVYVSRQQINALIGVLRQFKKEVAE